MKIIFFGGSKFSQFYLDAVKKSGLGEVFAYDELPSKEEIEKIAPDVGVVAYFGYIVPLEILKIPKKGFINVHYSLLPRWRGPAPVQFALLAGDREIGVTILLAEKKVDAGGILAQEKIPIEPNDTYLSLEEKLIPLGSKMLIDILPKYMEGSLTPKKQDEASATYSKKIKKEDGKIDWPRPPEEIERMVRAYHPWPGAFTFADGKMIKIKKAEVSGDVFKPLIVQPEGKKEMSYEAYLKGHRNPLFK